MMSELPRSMGCHVDLVSVLSDDSRKLMNLYSPVPPGLLREERRSLSRTSSCDRRFDYFLEGSSFVHRLVSYYALNAYGG
jgi:hypothetical protein